MLLHAAKKLPVLAVIATILLFSNSGSCAAQEQQAENRVWRDSTGKFELKARLLKSDATHVQLEREDGRKIDVPIDRLSVVDRKYLEARSTNQVAVADKYVHDRSPELDASWERVMARVKGEMGQKGFAKVAVVRVRLENEELEEKVLVGSEGLCFPRVVQYDSYSQMAVGFSTIVKSGGFVTVAVNTGNPPPDGRPPVLKVAGLKHYPVATQIDFAEGEVVCGGEILLKSVPEDSTGQLIVRCIPESRVNIGGGSITIAPDDCPSEEFQLGDGGIVKMDIAPGKYTVRSGRELKLQGPALEDITVRPNETTEVGLNLFRPRVVEFEWCCRNPKESLEWQRGTSLVKSGGYWNEDRFWNKAYGFYLSNWDGDSCTIQAVNHTSFVRSTEKELPMEDGEPLPSQPANFSDRVLLPVVEGAVFDCRYDGRSGGDHGEFEIMFKVKSIEPVED